MSSRDNWQNKRWLEYIRYGLDRECPDTIKVTAIETALYPDNFDMLLFINVEVTDVGNHVLKFTMKEEDGIYPMPFQAIMAKIGLLA